MTTLNEPESLRLLGQAKEIVFPAVSVPPDMETRRDLLPFVDPDAPRPEWAERLDELDRRFYANPDTLTPKLKLFAQKYGLVCSEINEEGA